MIENNKLNISNISYYQNILKIKPSKKNIIKIANFLNKNFKHINHSFEYKYFPFEMLNVFKLTEIYGYGNCKHASILFKFFMDTIGVKCSILYGEFQKDKRDKIQNHVFNIIELNNKKYLIDIDIGMITFNKNLIPYNGELNQKIFNYFKKKNKKNLYIHNKNSFINIYNEKFNETFSIDEKLYDYKIKLSKYYSELYFANFPFFNQKFKEKKIKKNFIIIQNKIYKKKINTKKVLQFYSTKFKVNDYFFKINNFPYLIVDLKVVPIELNKKNKTFTFTENRVNKKCRFNHFLFQKKKTISNPIYSFSLKSKYKIKYIEIIFQKSLLGKKLNQFINQINSTHHISSN